MKIDVLTLFPEMFVPVTGSSILGRAAESGILEINLTDIRDFSNDKHNKADDYPFGGGGGMVMMADPVFGALESVEAEHKKVIYMSPRGRDTGSGDDTAVFIARRARDTLRALRGDGSESPRSLEHRRGLDR